VGTIDPCYDELENNQPAPARHCGVPNLSVNGPWLNNHNTHKRNSPWSTYGTSSGIGPPGPALLWVLVDEDTQGLNDAAFAFGMQQQEWIDAPGSYHNRACGLAFADGHSEIHKWVAKPSNHSAANPIDWSWMQQRTSARAAN
jgi:prepilin-type processing-associated H-X9-DG protein